MNELKYLNVCYNSKENDEKFHELISTYTNNVFKYNNQDELIDLINNEEIHLVITKYNFELLKQIRVLNNQIQIIAFLDKINHTHLIESLEIEYVKFIQELNCVNEFIYILKDCVKNIDSQKSNIRKLKNNFIYDIYNKTLFKNNKIISLTKRESLFLGLLIKEYNRAISYEEINKEIWNNTMTQDALRSLVKEIRKKTYKELIINISGIGYRIDL
ncbi:winged helix-turn-helix domain-containing protein [bacterium]|nr:winged helix-turn-helix domain-containing protein [bacterium]